MHCNNEPRKTRHNKEEWMELEKVYPYGCRSDNRRCIVCWINSNISLHWGEYRYFDMDWLCHSGNLREDRYLMVYLFVRGVWGVYGEMNDCVFKGRVQCVKINQYLINLVYPCTILFLNFIFTRSKIVIILKIFVEFINSGIKKYLLQSKNIKRKLSLSSSSLLLFSDRKRSLLFIKILQQVEVVNNVSVSELLVASPYSFYSFFLLSSSRVTLIRNELPFCLNFLLRFSYVIHVYKYMMVFLILCSYYHVSVNLKQILIDISLFERFRKKGLWWNVNKIQNFILGKL